jgi:hypothetical protein
MPAAPSGAGISTHGAQHRHPAAVDRVQIDAVEVVARLLVGDRELRLVDQPPEIAARQLEADGHLARRQIGEVGLRQRLQREARAARPNHHAAAVAARLEHDLRALWQLAHDVVEGVRRQRRRARLRHFGRHRLDDLDVEVGRLQAQAALVGADEHVAENGKRGPPLDDAMHAAERLH